LKETTKWKGYTTVSGEAKPFSWVEGNYKMEGLHNTQKDILLQK